MFENIPGGEPEDMFAQVEGPSPAAPTAPVAKPTMPTAVPAAAASASAMAPTPSSVPSIPSMPKRGFPWKPIVGLVVAILIIGAGGAISYVFLSAKAPVVPAAQPSANGNANTTPSAPSAAPTTPVAQAPTSPVPTPTAAPELDSDGDGLSDAQEAEIGTNPQSADSDNDGLSDGEEIFIYHTNPLKSNTNGDGYPDGTAVLNLYDPAGKQGTTLLADAIVKNYDPTGSLYSIFYPSVWQAAVSAQDARNVIFTSADNATVTVSIEPKTSPTQTFAAWYASQNLPPSAPPALASNPENAILLPSPLNPTAYTTKQGLAAILSYNSTSATAYVDAKTNVLVLKYTSGPTTKTVEYLTTFRMMLNSLHVL